MKIGTAVSDITPPVGMKMAGYAERVGGSVGVHDALLLQTAVFAQNETRAVLIAADLIGLGDAFCAQVSQAIATHCAIPADHVWLVASHTHSGPAVPYSFMELADADTTYLAKVQAQMVADVELALGRLAGDFRLTVGVGQAAFAINRRKPNAQGEVEMLPNPDAPRDEQVTVLTFADAQSERRLILFHYACHADVLGSQSNTITAEYPGAARRFIEAALPGTTAVYLPGFAGDINPYVVNAAGEFAGTYADVLRLGATLGAEVVRVAQAGGLSRAAVPLVCRTAVVNLPLAALPPLAHWQAMAAADHSLRPPWEPDWAAFARYLLDNPMDRLRPFVPVRLSAWQFGRQVTLLGLGAEASVEYALWLKQMFPALTLVPVGYANGQNAYLATRWQILAGGYEVELGNVWYGHPVPFAPESEQRLLNGAAQFLRQK